jgi:hypothetical protein
VLKRLGLNRIAALEPAEPIRRYERAKPGDLIHIDIKKLAVSTRSATASLGTARAKAQEEGSDRLRQNAALVRWRLEFRNGKVSFMRNTIIVLAAVGAFSLSAVAAAIPAEARTRAYTGTTGLATFAYGWVPDYN